jgi:hypothetical protein
LENAAVFGKSVRGVLVGSCAMEREEFEFFKLSMISHIGYCEYTGG